MIELTINEWICNEFLYIFKKEKKLKKNLNFQNKFIYTLNMYISKSNYYKFDYVKSLNIIINIIKIKKILLL